jgi:uncharacterized protein YcbK (DUF882 family)
MIYFKEEEFKCPCCGELSLSPNLIPTLTDIRLIYKQPMVITSGYRCWKHNQAIGGVPTSEHLTGEGADVECTTSHDRYKLIDACLSVGIKRIGIGTNFIHIGISKTLPQEMIWLY